MISQQVLDEVVGMAATGPGSARDLIEQRLRQALRAPVAEFLGRGGKRIRAEMVTLAFRVATPCGEVRDCPEGLLEFLEWMHAGTLVIDDVQDGSATRRGRDALHVTYGIPLAVNLGNWMYFAALERLAGLELPPRRLCELMQRSLAVFKLGHEGQALDLSVRVTELPQAAVPEVVERITALKTGGFTELAGWMGAAVAGASEDVLQSVAGFGRQLGLALQMRNDWVELQRVAAGEGPSADLLNLRATWPWAWLALSLPSMEYREILEKLQRGSGQLPDLARRIVGQIEIQAMNAIHETLEEAASSLGGLDLDSECRARLNELLSLLEPGNV